MYTKVFIKLSIFYTIMSITQAATLDLCVTKRENSNTNVQYPDDNEINTNRLLLRDCPSYPFIDNAVDHIRSFIIDKLDLVHLEWHILQATYTDKGLLFEMSSREDVKEILDQFAVKLRNKECVLKTTLKQFFPMEIH
ncbi:uncharacterized protein LOC135951226 [Calliphora vicina]|uniref:uncharacterized protein LOC135951226 n=1 Tax=Calliphora vicina TaxID=7373 RepID=UPI00325B6FD5